MNIEIEKDQSLSKVISKLKDHFKLEKVYLFGSHAKGTATAGSDYDIFVIVKNSDKTIRDRRREARKLFWGDATPTDIFVYTESEFNELKDEFSSIAHTVATDGVELY